MANYLVVLFKNKKRKRIIKKFVTLSRTKKLYNQLINESKEVIFEVLVENGKECKFELGLIENKTNQSAPVYMTDDFGRSVKVKLEDSGMSLLEINPYREEELIYDVQTKKKITSQELIKKYFKTDGLKMLSVLNNKAILQKDEEIYLFSLKNESECSRFVDSLSSHFFKTKRGDCLFIKDYSSAQRKYLYELLESNGFDKKVLYRKFTTYPSSQ
jgi:predicted transcriptional regulator with HTH domain